MRATAADNCNQRLIARGWKTKEEIRVCGACYKQSTPNGVFIARNYRGA
jgi:hypothetical protein